MSRHWVDLSTPTTVSSPEGRTLLRLRGADTDRFLQGTLSASIEGLPRGEARPGALLTVKGKLVSDAIIVQKAEPAAEDGVVMGLAVPSALATEVAAMLDRHIIMDDVTVEVDRNATLAFTWIGGGDPPAAPTVPAGVDVFETSHPAPGHFVIGSPEAIASLVASSAPTSAPSWTRYRVETASPAWEHELVTDCFPPEVGFVAAVSYDKGCFMGQEPLARIHARGQVNWVMVRVEGTGTLDAAPVELGHPDRADAGSLTSIAPKTDAGDSQEFVGLAIARRAYAQPGTKLSTPNGVEVAVTSGPLGDDPGLKT